MTAGQDATRASAPHSPIIQIDGSSTVGPRTGIGRATAALLNACAHTWPEAWPPPRVWVNSPKLPLPAGDAWMQVGWPVVHTRWPGRVMLRGWQYLRRPRLDRLAGPAALFHQPSSYIPPVGGGARVITAHDVYFLHDPAQAQPYGGGYFAKTFPRLRGVDAVICDSEFTRGELQAAYGLKDEQLHVVPLGVDCVRFRPEAGEGEGSGGGLRDGEPYILCVATLEPRKNLPRLIEAYGRARARNPQLPRLVIAGARGWGAEAVDAALAKLGGAPGIEMAGYLPDDALPALYAGARFFVFPSLYEGFGMPLLEAMACGAPVLASDIPVHREVAAEAAEFVPPTDVEALAGALLRLDADAARREALRMAGLARAAAFSWDATARGTIEVYRKVLGL